jgi:hypothetical protein
MTTAAASENLLLPASQRLRDILRSGIQAPSAENRHYLQFEMGRDRVKLLSTDTATWSNQPHRRMLALLSYGAVVENMTLRAAQLGEAQTTQWLPDRAQAALIAECRWTPVQSLEDSLAQAIAQRHTNRRFYRRTPVASASLQRMSAAATAVPGAELVWLDEPAARATALQAVRIAETERFRRPALHQELFSAVDFSLGWRRSSTEGLPPGTLEVEPPMRPGFAALGRWPVMRVASRLGLHHMLGLRAAYMPCRLAPHLALLRCDGDDAQLAALGAGRALQRTWLAATAEGLAFQPMAAATALARQNAGNGWVSSGAQRDIVERLERLTDGRPTSAFMFLRVGHASPPSLVTGRRDVDDYLVPSVPR